MVEKSRDEKHWSDNEKIAAGILLGVLAASLALFGLIIIYEPPTGPGLCGALGPAPCPGREALNVMSATLNSPTNMTLQIYNTGSAALTFISYYVKTQSGQTYSNPSWSGPTVPPNRVASINIIIDGSAFTFQSHNSYTVTIVTSRNTQFTYVAQT